MRTVLFIHSAGAQTETDGSTGLVAALQGGLPAGFELIAPMMPEPENPKAAAWNKTLGRHLAEVHGPVVLVGHSLGGSVILKYLAEHDAPPALMGVVSIAAPFWGTQDWEREWALPSGFAARLSRLPRLVFYHSADDDVIPPSQLERYSETLPRALIRRVNGRRHLFDDGNVDDIVADICA